MHVPTPPFEKVYAELRAIAQHYVSREHAAPLDATSLAHEAYVRLAPSETRFWRSQQHFFAVAARAIRRILVDHARRRNTGRRVLASHADEQPTAVFDPSGDNAVLIDLDAALTELAELSSRQAEIVELRYFGGLSIDEVADVLQCSPRTVDEDWRMARQWLRRRLEHQRPTP